MPVALGLDFGTTSISAVAVADDGRLVARATRAHRADVGGLPSGFAEQNPDLLLSTALDVLVQLRRQDCLPTAMSAARSKQPNFDLAAGRMEALDVLVGLHRPLVASTAGNRLGCRHGNRFVQCQRWHEMRETFKTPVGARENLK